MNIAKFDICLAQIIPPSLSAEFVLPADRNLISAEASH